MPGLDGLAGIGVRFALPVDLGVPGRLREGFDNGDGRDCRRERGEALGELRGDGRGEIGFSVFITNLNY